MARIVIVDDEQDVCEVLEARLKLDGHEVRTTNSGDVAIDLGYLFQPDILIADWKLKCEYDGLEVAEAFAVAKKNIKTILMSGYEVGKCDTCVGFSRHFAIPFSFNELTNAVDRALAMPQG